MEKQSKTISVSDWLLTNVVMMFPFINFIILIVWAFSESIPKSKQNWAKANLIFMSIMMVLFFMLLLAVM